MKNSVLYASRSKKDDVPVKNDHARTIAGAIGGGAHALVYPIGKHTFVTDTDILFIGCEVAGNGKIKGGVRKVLENLSPSDVNAVAVFSVSTGGSISALREIKSLLAPKGIRVCDEEFFCMGASAFRNKGYPTATDMSNAQKFGAEIVAKY